MCLKGQERIDFSLEDSEYLQGLTKPELTPGERLVWVSESRGGSRGPHAVAVMLIVALISFIAGLVVLGLAWLSSFDALASYGIVLILLAFFLACFAVLGRILRVAQWRMGPRNRRRRVYALTDRRAIIWLPLAWSKAVEIRSYPRGSIRPESIRRIQLPDGSGDFLFLPAHQEPTGFRGVANVRQVDELFRRYLVTETLNINVDQSVAEMAFDGLNPLFD